MNWSVNIEKVNNGYVLKFPPEDEDHVERVTVIEIEDFADEIIAEMKAFEKLHYELREHFGVNNDKHKNLFMELSIEMDGEEVGDS